jgi:FKBP-type peptidyl-prolyl cis-trans isomerase SlyD
MLIDDDVWVTVRYRLFDSQGDAIEPSERQLTYLQGGYGAVFPRIEQALEGHGVGYRTSLVLEPEDSFGDYDPELVRLASREDFPQELEVGMTFEGVPGDEDEEEAGMYIVTDFTDEAVVLDGNHPLAGMSLRFELQVLDVRPASEEEVEQERALAQARGDDGDLEADDDEPDGSADEDDSDDPDDEEGDDGGKAREVRRLH